MLTHKIQGFNIDVFGWKMFPHRWGLLPQLEHSCVPSLATCETDRQ